MKLITRGTTIFDRTLDLLAVLAGTLLIFTMLAISYDVVFRYFLNRPLGWVVEISEYVLLYITFLGTAWLLRREGHVKIDIVFNRLSSRNQSLLNIVTSIIAAIACLALAWWGVDVTLDNFQRNLVIRETLDVPKFILIAVIPLGSFLLFAQFLRRAYGNLASWRLTRGKREGL